MSRKQVTDVLTDAAISYFLKKGYSCFTELGLNSWGKLRGDVVCLNLKMNIVISEIKSSKVDFESDTKWSKYLTHCNKLYFVFLPQVFESIKASVLLKVKPLGVGILVLDPISGYLKVVSPAKNRKMLRVDKQKLITRMAWRNGISKAKRRRKRHFITEETT